MEKDHILDENPHQTYNNVAQPLEQTGEPQSGSKKVKQQNHSRAIRTREG
ncbi:small acid-soluble spore protein P [Brevibacillus sp. M2.1A]|nr:MULTISPECIES: small acid-soluble spore protein P [Brevibacillus]MBY0087690.1 small acid-soluble spore protein P [Brevibacillus brevis]MCC8436739.1 small acid-soluble spore protein P [Brevibacillus sp. M2.1A]MCE0448730.1 small acid-soluble spore protein P [Brevibacillus sp. AF8]MCM3141226.1 small acid-soluble spore protein P [Brevibacillus sp. MER 51]UKK98917.1 small acid-soluble spore protein P [Brevibacillus brevis]